MNKHLLNLPGSGVDIYLDEAGGLLQISHGNACVFAHPGHCHVEPVSYSAFSTHHLCVREGGLCVWLPIINEAEAKGLADLLARHQGDQ